MVIGIMASGLNKKFVSENRFAQEGLAQGFDPGESAFLIRNMPYVHEWILGNLQIRYP